MPIFKVKADFFDILRAIFNVSSFKIVLSIDLLINPIFSALSAVIKSPPKSISIECLFNMFLEIATIGVEQNKPILTPGVANLDKLLAYAKSQLAIN